MPKIKERWEPVSEGHLQDMAHILGPSSAAYEALRNAEQRRREGQTVEFFTVYRGRSRYTVVKGSS